MTFRVSLLSTVLSVAALALLLLLLSLTVAIAVVERVPKDLLIGVAANSATHSEEWGLCGRLEEEEKKTGGREKLAAVERILLPLLLLSGLFWLWWMSPREAPVGGVTS